MVKCDSEVEFFLNNAQNAGGRAQDAETGRVSRAGLLT